MATKADRTCGMFMALWHAKYEYRAQITLLAFPFSLFLFFIWFCHQCEVEGVLPNVTVTLALPPNGSPLQDILVHPCVTSVDSSILTSNSVDNYDGSAFSGPYKFPFSPPLESFRLCSYTSQVKFTPTLIPSTTVNLKMASVTFH